MLLLDYRRKLLLIGWIQVLHSTRTFLLKCNHRTFRCQVGMKGGRHPLGMVQRVCHGPKAVMAMHIPGRGVGMNNRCPRMGGPVPINWIRARVRAPAPVPPTIASQHLLPRSFRLRETPRTATRHSLPYHRLFHIRRTLPPCIAFLHRGEPVQATTPAHILLSHLCKQLFPAHPRPVSRTNTLGTLCPLHSP